MYRQNDRAAKPPTVVQYESKRVRIGYLFLAVVLFLFGIGLIAGIHFTHLTCTRSGAPESATCRVQRYGVVRPLDEYFSAGEVASFDVQIHTGSKGRKYAEVRLFMTRESHRGTIELETGAWGHVDPHSALAARSAFSSFQSGKQQAADVWMKPSVGTMAIMALFGVVIIAIGVAMMREQIGQLRPIRIVIDHDREVVLVRRHEIPWREIEDVRVDFGRALTWSSGKNEHVPGYRLVFVRRAGDVPATKEYRAGNPSAHERARKMILRALGRERD